MFGLSFRLLQKVAWWYITFFIFSKQCDLNPNGIQMNLTFHQLLLINIHWSVCEWIFKYNCYSFIHLFRIEILSDGVISAIGFIIGTPIHPLYLYFGPIAIILASRFQDMVHQELMYMYRFCYLQKLNLLNQLQLSLTYWKSWCIVEKLMFKSCYNFIFWRRTIYLKKRIFNFWLA